MEKLIVWHFAGEKLRDGSPLPKDGEALPHIPNPKPCARGWHGSVRILDALRYAPGTMLARRELRGVIIAHVDDKHCASDAVQIGDYVDVWPALIRFARRAALHALRVDAAEALGDAGFSEHAEKLRALPDNCNLRATADAARAAADAADAARAAADDCNLLAAAADAAYAAADAAYAARAAADAAAYAACAAYAADAACAAYAAAAYAAARDRLNTWLLEEVKKGMGE